jgi:serine/threonine protein kinase
MLLITTAEPPQLVNKDKVSDKFNNFLARCLKMDAEKRPSAEELLEDELFQGQNHKAVMAGLLAEYRINKLVNESSDSLSDKQNTDDDDGSCVLMEEALEVFEEDAKRPVFKRTESSRSTSSNSSLGTISHGDIDKIAFINDVVKQKKQWA